MYCQVKCATVTSVGLFHVELTLLRFVWRRRYWIANLSLLGFRSLSDLCRLHVRFFWHVHLINFGYVTSNYFTSTKFWENWIVQSKPPAWWLISVALLSNTIISNGLISSLERQVCSKELQNVVVSSTRINCSLITQGNVMPDSPHTPHIHSARYF